MRHKLDCHVLVVHFDLIIVFCRQLKYLHHEFVLLKYHWFVKRLDWAYPCSALEADCVASKVRFKVETSIMCAPLALNWNFEWTQRDVTFKSNLDFLGIDLKLIIVVLLAKSFELVESFQVRNHRLVIGDVSDDFIGLDRFTNEKCSNICDFPFFFILNMGCVVR